MLARVSLMPLVFRCPSAYLDCQWGLWGSKKGRELILRVDDHER